MYARSPFLTFVHEESLILSVYEESLILSVYEESLLTLVRGVPSNPCTRSPALGVLVVPRSWCTLWRFWLKSRDTLWRFGSKVGTLFGPFRVFKPQDSGLPLPRVLSGFSAASTSCHFWPTRLGSAKRIKGGVLKPAGGARTFLILFYSGSPRLRTHLGVENTPWGWNTPWDEATPLGG